MHYFEYISLITNDNNNKMKCILFIIIKTKKRSANSPVPTSTFSTVKKKATQQFKKQPRKKKILFLQFKKNVRSKVKSFPPDSAPDEKAKKQ